MNRAITLSLLSATIAAGALAGVAWASDDDGNRSVPPREEWMSIAELAAKLEGDGYRIREIEVDDRYYDVELIDDKGRKIDADVHPVTGAFLEREYDD
ncbi:MULTISPECIES: PepSY domain-containing protein [unclassified Roseitalea]|uniref:PepSY domain-containing protein n=1 Tax=unclassified Roseitalea TaxID=2639107 RepID=UPI00273F5280|nr:MULTISPECIES: PepSY domain-containing protein [unclassified Roseitalea]